MVLFHLDIIIMYFLAGSIKNIKRLIEIRNVNEVFIQNSINTWQY